MREKLIELRQEAEKIAYDFCFSREECDKCPYNEPNGCQEGMIADHLIAHGVTVQPIKIGDTVYGQFDWYGKEIKECKIVKVKVCQFRDKSFHCFLDVEFDITDPYYRDGRVMRCMQQATYGENYGTWHRVYASREEAEKAMPQPPKGE